MEAQQQELDKFGRPLPPKSGRYLLPFTATDALVFKSLKPEDLANKDSIEVLLITRNKLSTAGLLAIPGGHLEYNEDPEEGCIRELKEETNLDGKVKGIVDVRGNPTRDPRGHYISFVYLVEVSDFSTMKAGDDASEAHLYTYKFVKENKAKLAFDHYDIITDAIAKLSA